MPTINQSKLFIEFLTAEPILVRESLALATKEIFEPAVIQMQQEFERHPVTREIDGNIESSNLSRTLPGGKTSEFKNLFSFIGFDRDDQPIEEIRQRLNPESPDGPKIKYIRGSQVQNLTFVFSITPPNEEAIYKNTPIPWAVGLSWVKRLQIGGIPGFSQFLNTDKSKASRSGGGIQIKGILPGRRPFKTVDYINKIIGNFTDKFK